jgi:hypothetical protein
MPNAATAGFATILLWLIRAVDTQKFVGRLAVPLSILIFGRIKAVRQRFDRLVARLAAGTYVPRHAAPRRQPASRAPRRPNPLPHKSGWLLALVPEAVQYRAQLEHHLRDPEMAALLAAAPAPMARVLRPLCWWLGITPPAILSGRRAARPKPPAAPPRRPAAAPAAPPDRRSRPARARRLAVSKSA